MALLEKHIDKWEPEPMSGCYLWVGALRGGRIKRQARPMIRVGRISKYAAKEFLNEITPQPSLVHQVSHKCNNIYCVNPDHLVWETPSENMKRSAKVWPGVSYHKNRKKWQVIYKKKHIGLFDTKEEAIAAREKYASLCHIDAVIGL